MKDLLDDPASAILDIDRTRGRDHPLRHAIRSSTSACRWPASLIPWIDKRARQRPEQGRVEGPGRDQQDPRPRGQPDPDRRPVRAHRRHALPQPGADHQAQARTCRSTRSTACWPRPTSGCKVVPNEREIIDARTDPGGGHRHARRCRSAACASSTWGREYLTAFTCGDQLLWGAAEPLRRMLRILIEA
ncbi:MAG: hypothetical protein MZW92_29170 [Comamonadaceae bacterium]|nr:hypothetical protein [Comamonadaceae bacterium]